MLNRAIRLDPIDVKILDLLQRNARIPNSSLAETVGLSPSPCLQRVRRLERAGYIASYAARLELARIGEAVTIFAEIRLADHSTASCARFEGAIRRIDEAMECHRIGSGYDYLIKFVTRCLSHYQDVMESLLDRNIGIITYSTFIVLRTPIRKPERPLSAWFGG